MAGERLRPEQQDDLAPGTRQACADQAADASRAEDRVPHGSIVTLADDRHKVAERLDRIAVARAAA
jgi:hypothetical protein